MQDFDRQIKTLLEDAEVEVPSGVWDVVSAGLDRADAKKKIIVPPVWWRRAGIAIAAAAAAVLGVFIFTGKDNSTYSPYFNSLVTANKPAAFDVVLTPARDIALGGRTLAMAGTKDVQEEAIEADANTELSIPQAVPNANESTGTPKAPKAKKDSEQDDTDAINRLAFEEEKSSSRRPTSLSVGSNILSNGSPSGRKSGMMRSVAKGPTKTGISDPNTSSIFGIPVSVGIGVEIPLSNRLSLGTGVGYTYLSRSFTGTYTEIVEGEVTKSVTGDIDNYQHYIGIPVNLYYHVIDSKNIRFYGYGGLTLEKNISNHYRVHYTPSDINWLDPAKGLQFSVGAGIGVEFLFSNSFGIYVDPGIRYYFDCGQPRSIRTQQPLMMNFEVGLRFGL